MAIEQARRQTPQPAEFRVGELTATDERHRILAMFDGLRRVLATATAQATRGQPFAGGARQEPGSSAETRRA